MPTKKSKIIKVAKKRILKKKKPQFLFKNDPEVQSQELHLEKLIGEWNDIKTDLSQTNDELNEQTAKIANPADFFGRMPLESMEDFFEFAAGRAPDFNLEILKNRQELIKEIQNKALELQRKSFSVGQSQIDLLLAKISSMEKALQ